MNKWKLKGSSKWQKHTGNCTPPTACPGWSVLVHVEATAPRHQHRCCAPITSFVLPLLLAQCPQWLRSTETARVSLEIRQAVRNGRVWQYRQHDAGCSILLGTSIRGTAAPRGSTSGVTGQVTRHMWHKGAGRECTASARVRLQVGKQKKHSWKSTREMGKRRTLLLGLAVLPDGLAVVDDLTCARLGP